MEFFFILGIFIFIFFEVAPVFVEGGQCSVFFAYVVCVAIVDMNKLKTLHQNRNDTLNAVQQLRSTTQY